MKFKYSISYRSYLVPEISGVKKPVLDKSGNTVENDSVQVYDQKTNRNHISLKLAGNYQVRIKQKPLPFIVFLL